MIGLATIGQSPREDVLPSMFSDTLLDVILQAGALDGLSAADVSKLSPVVTQHPLVTRLRTGEEVVISKERVTPLLEIAIQRLEDKGATLICVLCTGEFDLNAMNSRIVFPDRVMKGVVDSLMPEGNLGVVIPHAGQAESMRRKWERPARSVSIDVVSPYAGQVVPEVCVERLSAAQCDMIVLDCMGYTIRTQRAVQRGTSVPVVLANRLVGAILESMIASSQAR